MFQSKFSLSGLAGSEWRKWRESGEEGRRTSPPPSPTPSPQRSSTPGDIITIEDSEVEAGHTPRPCGEAANCGREASQASSSPRVEASHTSSPSVEEVRVEPRSRRRSRLAANFSGSEH